MKTWELIEEKALEIEKARKWDLCEQYFQKHRGKEWDWEKILDEYSIWAICEKVAEWILEEEAQEQWEKKIEITHPEYKEKMIRLMDDDEYWVDLSGGDNWESCYWSDLLELRTAKREHLERWFA